MQARVFNAVALITALTAAGLGPAQAAVPEFEPVVVKTFPHDTGAFTEGLLYQDGFLYESTGRNGQSSIRKVDLETGKVIQQHDLEARYFGEGIVIWKNRVIGLTWKSETGFIFDVASFNPLSEFHYKGEGWGMTRDAKSLFMSDGTSDVRVLDPETLAEQSRIHVTCDGHPIKNINELEWINGEIFANIWLTNVIVRIAPATGEVDGLLDVSKLTALAAQGHTIDVPNGIAYDQAGDRMFVTGKLWPSLYQITLAPRPNPSGLCQSLP